LPQPLSLTYSTHFASATSISGIDRRKIGGRVKTKRKTNEHKGKKQKKGRKKIGDVKI
jgi:hypothetical protein